ncbi:hypothetical protein PAXINDRAFT_20442 [Paxillus involutus ATCC 200175]|uniref:Uncharacterized protein n=1 Tax=Paxillus involutus ATCC 200175 TaxID=664439 RepID=A0A0C9T4P1_PAXIN|nr:hypothetical protein PAXINDRAFT_20442 [Paxillus involutus ATCC 200175]
MSPFECKSRGPTGPYNEITPVMTKRNFSFPFQLMEGLQVPPDLQLRLTDLIADYMLDRLGDYMSTDPAITPSVPSPFIPVNAMQQADRFAEMLTLAYNNPIPSTFQPPSILSNASSVEPALTRVLLAAEPVHPYTIPAL